MTLRCGRDGRAKSYEYRLPRASTRNITSKAGLEALFAHIQPKDCIASLQRRKTVFGLLEAKFRFLGFFDAKTGFGSVDVDNRYNMVTNLQHITN